MGRFIPLTDAERQQIRELHAQGLGRNAIARQLGRSGQTISAAAEAMGLSFERATEVQAATRAAVTDARARRAALVLQLLDDAHRLREQIWQACKIYNFGGRDNTYNECDVPEPPPADKLKLMQAAGAAIDRSLRLAEYDAGDNGQIAGLLGSLFVSLQRKHGDGTEPTEPPADGPHPHP